MCVDNYRIDAIKINGDTIFDRSKSDTELKFREFLHDFLDFQSLISNLCKLNFLTLCSRITLTRDMVISVQNNTSVRIAIHTGPLT